MIKTIIYEPLGTTPLTITKVYQKCFAASRQPGGDFQMFPGPQKEAKWGSKILVPGETNLPIAL